MSDVATRPAPERTGAQLGKRSLSSRLVTVGYGLIALVIGLIGWEFLHYFSEGWVPGVERIAGTLVEETLALTWVEPFRITVERLLIAFLVTLGLGVLIGSLMGANGWIEAYGRPLLVMGLAIPDPVYFMLGLLLLGTSEFAAMTALVIAVLPLVTNVVLAGVQNRDFGLDEMSRVYKLGLGLYMSEVLFRQIVPMLVAAARTAFAFSWKLVVLMEALTQSDGIGHEVYFAFRLLRPDLMIVYAIIFIVLMNVIERLVFARLERAGMRWSA